MSILRRVSSLVLGRTGRPGKGEVMRRSRTSIGVGLAVAAALAVGAQAGSSPSQEERGYRIAAGKLHCLDVEPAPGDARPDWLKALEVRSIALNCLYGLGEFAPDPSRSVVPASADDEDCLDTEPAPGDARPDWLQALEVRSSAMNCLYGLD